LGLKGELKAFVKIFRPTTLDNVFYYTLHMENALDSQQKYFKPPIKPSAPCSSKLNHQTSTSEIPSLIRSVSWVFILSVGKKYFSRHQCKIKVQILLGQNQNEPLEEDTHV
jgi:hypothetical protein